ncbi:pyridoxamine 5'-phosphate oxidase family protein [Micromonospora profundi]|uniref:Pyridoxamine 5'-phosphate oxidase family protein n=1 Tax=Micromonospora profundi TaxID=1420889 RepID=A0AAJ6HXG1_9ACTN|nr:MULTISPECIES: pyridoxamine 5'-phosphate oxidase family protein [Micromonospora]KOX06764.1 pyridoxamine 5'-phosphate oxidase [Micromonospora sp. NRRL B-16802]NJC11041.1 general stress protein 26 [Micromonospora profundi]WLS48546.1 pyridoxamine 5'-phosphate oxidase family protein [Micromonospora profundi]
MSNEPTSVAEARARVTELVREARICMFTTIGLDGRLVSRPMGLQEAEFDGDLWFFASADSAKARQIRVNPEVNVAFSDQKRSAWVSVAGTATEGFDRDRAEQLWNPVLTVWFPQGPDTPGLTLIKVHASSAEYWDSPSSTVVNLFGFARAVVTGQPPAPGENHEVTY